MKYLSLFCSTNSLGTTKQTPNIHVPKQIVLKENKRKNNFGLFYAEFVADFKSGKIFLLRFAVFLIFALLSVNYVTAWTREFPEAETRLSRGAVKILG